MTRELEEKKYHRMLEAPVEKLMLELALPAIVSMLCTSFYNMADTFYVSKLNTSSTAAVGVTFATMSVIQAIAFFFGIGSGNSISRLLGAKEHKKAEIMAATSLFDSLFAASCWRSLEIYLWFPSLPTLAPLPRFCPMPYNI